MSENKKQKSNEIEKASSSENSFTFTGPSDKTFSLNRGASEAKPFVFGSDSASKPADNNIKGSLSHEASISSLVEQRKKMADARRHKKSSANAAASASLRLSSESKPYVFKVDAPSPSEIKSFVFKVETSDASTALSESKPFAFKNDSTILSPVATSDVAFSPGSTGSVSRTPSTMVRGRKVSSDRGCRNIGARSSGTDRRIMNGPDRDKSAASAPEGVLKDGSNSTSGSSTDTLEHEAAFCSCGEYFRDEEAPEPEGTFRRAPEVILSQRRVVHVKKNFVRNEAATLSTGIGSNSPLATSAAEPSESPSDLASKLEQKEQKDASSNGTAAAASARGSDTTDNTNDGNDSSMPSAAGATATSDAEDGDSSMPPLEPSNLNENTDGATNNRGVENGGGSGERESGNQDSTSGDDDDEISRDANPFAPLAESEEDPEEEEEDDDSEDGDSEESECMCSECMSERYNDMTFAADNDRFDEDDEDNKCCICFCTPSRSNRIAKLPCCGSESGEDTSTVKFCNKCIVKCLKSQNSDAMSTFFLYVMEEDYIGECPRCRSLISVSKRDSRALNRRNIVRCPTFREAVRHAFRYQDKNMRAILYTASCVYPHHMPAELFDDDAERAHQLCRWRILKEVKKGKVYAIDPEKQAILKKIAEARIEDTDEDPDEPSSFSPNTIITLRTCLQLFLASFYAIAKFKVIVACRMFNQGVAMLMVGAGALPAGLHRPWQGMIVTCLNGLLLTMLFQMAFLVIAYVIIGYGTVKAVGWWLATPGIKSLLRRVFYTCVAFLTVLGMYHVGKYDSALYVSMAIGTFAGGCHCFDKSMTDAARGIWAHLP